MVPIKDVNAADVSLEAFMSAHEEAQVELKESYQRMVKDLYLKYVTAGNPPSPAVEERVRRFVGIM